jgi:hypothetical protein
MARKRRYWWVEMGWYGTLRNGVVTLWHIGWQGIPDQCTAFPSEGRVGQSLLAEVERQVQAMLDRKDVRKVVGSVSPAVVDLDFSSSHPVLFMYMTQRTWSDGAARQTSSLTLFEDGGRFKAVLKDRNENLSLWGSSPTLSGLLDVMEALVCDPEAEWRTERTGPGTQASRVKKRTA